MAKQLLTPQSLRSILSFFLIVIVLGGTALFYFGLEAVRTYAVSVNQRLEDANASDKQVGQLQTLKNQLAQSESLIEKANSMFATPDSYQSQALTDIQNYANKAGVQIESTGFENAETGIYTVVVKLANPTSYSKLIQFLALTEGNLPKMQVSSIDLKHIPGSDGDTVETGEIKINISVR